MSVENSLKPHGRKCLSAYGYLEATGFFYFVPLLNSKPIMIFLYPPKELTMWAVDFDLVAAHEGTWFPWGAEKLRWAAGYSTVLPWNLDKSCSNFVIIPFFFSNPINGRLNVIV